MTYSSAIRSPAGSRAISKKKLFWVLRIAVPIVFCYDTFAMTPHDDSFFQSPTHGQLSLRQVLEQMSLFQQRAPGAAYRLLIGTDSLPSAGGIALLVTAAVLLRVGNGGVYFWRRERFERLHTLRLRMYQEALASIETARLFVGHPECLELLSADIEIHVDIGHRGPTRDMIREIVGMVKANGFPVFTKPDAVAASKVADRHTVVLSRA